jgi:predicted membrane protein
MEDIVKELLSGDAIFFVFVIIGLFYVFGTIFHVLLAILAYIVVMHVVIGKHKGSDKVSSEGFDEELTYDDANQYSNEIQYDENHYDTY